jgi:hypothetical protein
MEPLGTFRPKENNDVIQTFRRDYLHSIQDRRCLLQFFGYPRL